MDCFSKSNSSESVFGPKKRHCGPFFTTNHNLPRWDTYLRYYYPNGTISSGKLKI